MSDKARAVDLKEKAKNFFKDKLNIELSEEKTKITNIGREKATFLGINISSSRPKEKKIIRLKGKNKTVRQRASHSYIKFDVPLKKLKDKMITNEFLEIRDGKFYTKAITKWIFLNHDEILFRYN
jgi:hypothetical protein